MKEVEKGREEGDWFGNLVKVDNVRQQINFEFPA